MTTSWLIEGGFVSNPCDAGLPLQRRDVRALGAYASVMNALARTMCDASVLQRDVVRHVVHARMSALGMRSYRDFAAYLHARPDEASAFAATGSARADARASGIMPSTRRRRGGWASEMFRTSPIASAVVDGEGRVCVVNPAGRTLLNRPRVKGLLLDRCVVSEDRTKIITAIADLWSGRGRRAEVSARLRPKGGAPRDARVRMVAHPRRDRILVGLVVDEGERAEELARRLAQATSERSRLERDNRAKDQFLAVLSHDLRGPISSVIGWTQLLRRGVIETGASDRALATIERSARNQLALVEELLDVTRITEAKVELDLAPVDMARLTRRSVDAILPACKDRGIVVRVELSGTDCVVQGDETRLQQACMNLLTNAVKFSDRGGLIEVRLYCADGAVHFCVRDTGVGIASDLLPFVFERFRQGADITKRNGGLGLGLYIAKHVVELHGGSIEAESDGKTRGATFTLRLRKSDERPEPAIDSVSTLSQRADLSGVSLLLIDDDADARSLFETMLGRFGAFVTATGDSETALTAFDVTKPDVVLCDIGLPGIDGYSLLRRLRDRPGGRHVAALALTAYVSPDDARRAEAAGFDAHVPKPVAPDELVRAIQDARERVRSRAS